MPPVVVAEVVVAPPVVPLVISPADKVADSEAEEAVAVALPPEVVSPLDPLSPSLVASLPAKAPVSVLDEPVHPSKREASGNDASGRVAASDRGRRSNPRSGGREQPRPYDPTLASDRSAMRAKSVRPIRTWSRHHLRARVIPSWPQPLAPMQLSLN